MRTMPRLLAVIAMTVLVLLLHVWLLVALPWSLTAPPPPREAAPAFDTRSITPPPAPPPQTAPTLPTPRPQPRPATRPAAPIPVPPSAPVAAAVPPPSDDPLREAAPTPAASAEDAPSAPTPEARHEDTAPPAESAAATDDAMASPTPGAPAAAITLRTAGGAPEQTDLPYQAPPAQQLVFQVQGQVKGLHYNATAQLLWLPQEGRYQAQQEIRAFLLGARTQKSHGQIVAGGLQPERFEDLARKKLRAATLDWDSHQAQFEPAASSAPIASGTQDRLSVFLQLAGMLAAAPERYPSGAEVTLATASTKAVEPWRFQVHALESLPLPSGAMDALRLERLPRRAGDQKAELWLAPALGYLPVRIRLSEGNGDYADLQLQSHSHP